MVIYKTGAVFIGAILKTIAGVSLRNWAHWIDLIGSFSRGLVRSFSRGRFSIFCMEKAGAKVFSNFFV